MGFLFGATWSVTRAVMLHLSPKESLNHAFSYYTLSERFSTFAGPLSWGLITSLMIHQGPIRYRIALISMTVFIIIGIIAVRKIPTKSPVVINQ
jgi:MFS transporter, UMF1 family